MWLRKSSIRFTLGWDFWIARIGTVDLQVDRDELPFSGSLFVGSLFHRNCPDSFGLKKEKGDAVSASFS